MRLLASAQLIQTARGAAGGTFVAHPAPDAVAESLSETIELWFQAGSTSAAEVDQARAWIERGCVRYAAENATEEDLEAIRAPIDAAEDVDDVDRFLELDLEFHVAISRAAHNSVLELAMTAVHLARPRTNTLLLFQLQLPPIVEQHRSIYEAIRARDPDRAEAAFHEHVEHLRRVQAEALANRDAGSIAIGSISEAHPAPG